MEVLIGSKAPSASGIRVPGLGRGGGLERRDV